MTQSCEMLSVHFEFNSVLSVHSNSEFCGVLSNPSEFCGVLLNHSEFCGVLLVHSHRQVVSYSSHDIHGSKFSTNLFILWPDNVRLYFFMLIFSALLNCTNFNYIPPISSLLNCLFTPTMLPKGSCPCSLLYCSAFLAIASTASPSFFHSFVFITAFSEAGKLFPSRCDYGCFSFSSFFHKKEQLPSTLPTALIDVYFLILHLQFGAANCPIVCASSSTPATCTRPGGSSSSEPPIFQPEAAGSTTQH